MQGQADHKIETNDSEEQSDYSAGYESGKKKKLTENVNAAIVKKVNLYHSQVIFYKAFA